MHTLAASLSACIYQCLCGGHSRVKISSCGNLRMFVVTAGVLLLLLGICIQHTRYALALGICIQQSTLAFKKHMEKY